MLDRDLSRRLDIKGVASHPWFLEEGSESEGDGEGEKCEKAGVEEAVVLEDTVVIES